MGLLSCPDCGGTVSDRASCCPKCGCPIEVVKAEQVITSNDNTKFWSNIHANGKEKTGKILQNLGFIASRYLKENIKNILDWNDIVQIVPTEYGCLGLRKNGSLVSTGEIDCPNWNDIVFIAGHRKEIVAITFSGDIRCTEECKKRGYDFSDWHNIVAVDLGQEHCLGLRSDGTVIAMGSNENGECDVKSWNNIIEISAGYGFSLGLCNDGTVYATGKNDYGQCDVLNWRDIVKVSAGWMHSLGLTSDGKVVASGKNYSMDGGVFGTIQIGFGQIINGTCDVNEWFDVLDIAATSTNTFGLMDSWLVHKGDSVFGLPADKPSSQWHDMRAIFVDHSFRGKGPVIGLRKDGLVIPVGSNNYGQSEIFNWKLIETIKVCNGGNSLQLLDNLNPGKTFYDDHKIVILNKDHTVDVREYSIKGITGWKNICQVDAGWHHILGLKFDGSVVAAGADDNEQCTGVRSWPNDIIAIAAGAYHSVGLRSNGKVVASNRKIIRQIGEYEWTDYNIDTSDWENIIEIAAVDILTFGLNNEGHVLVAGDEKSRLCEVKNWNNILSISTGFEHIVGLKKDGTVEATGDNTFGQCNVLDWSNIIELKAGPYYTIGLKSDGTVLITNEKSYEEVNTMDFNSAFQE